MPLYRTAIALVFATFTLPPINGCSTMDTEVATPAMTQTRWQAGAMAAAANPHAVDAALAMLEAGGHAVDAAIAAHAVLGLVEPQSSGLGGGAFMLVYQRDENTLVFHDGREVAPAGASPDMFMQGSEAMGFMEAWQSGLSIGVPGVVALYEDTHRRYGKLPWKSLFAPAIELARDGFVVSPRMANFLPRIAELGRLDENPGAAEYFYPDGQPLQAGQSLKNPAYANTLERIAGQGSAAFYEGEIARAMAEQAQAEPHPGTLTIEDIAAYETRDREVICGPFREFRICAPVAPSSATAQIMMLSYYDRFTEPDMDRLQKMAAFVDAQRLAYADRDHYFGDPDFVSVPLQSLLAPEYLLHRAGERFAPDATPSHGTPGDITSLNWSADRTEEAAGTTHLSLVDSEGNAVSMTATVEAPFGSGRWAAGFLLNNEMTDFSREYDPSAQPQANAVGARKRPRSSMSPIMVFDESGELVLVTGSPGGNSIPAYVFKSLVAVLDWDMTPQQAADFPNVIARGNKVRVEVSAPEGQKIADMLSAAGYPVEERQGENSGLHIIMVEDGALLGAADSRREGKVGAVAP